MKKIIFMRHGYLEGKYDDYSKLDFNDFENLLLKRITPRVNRYLTKRELQSKKILSEVEFIICSSENRSIETAQIVKEIIGVEFEISSLLDEISFKKGIIEEKDIKDFNTLRKIILTKFHKSKHSENFDVVKKRFLGFLDYVKELNYDTILCVTHGWFMRLINIYSVRNSLENVSFKELLDTRVPDFLDTVEVKIGNQ